MTPTPRKYLRAGLYVRLSQDAANQTSTERQEADCRALAKAKGYRVAGVYSDVGISGFKKVDRPEYDRLLSDVRAGAIDVIVVWKLDRLTRGGIRSLAPLLDLLEATGCTLVAVQDSIDTATAMGEGVLGLLASMAKQESQNISTRTKSAKAHGAANGAPAGGGRRPFGYQVVKRDGTKGCDYVIDDLEADLLREAARRRLAGESVRAIAADWTAQKVPTSSGGSWTSAQLSRTLRSPFHAGLRSHTTTNAEGTSTTTVYPGTWPAIFTVDEHQALVAARGHQYPTRVRRHLLTDVIRCSCGGNMAFKSTERFGRQYVCRRCERVTINADMVEGAVSEAVAEVVDSPAVRAAFGQQTNQADADELIAAIAGDREALRQLTADCYVEKVISRDEFLSARGPLADRIEANEARLERLQSNAHAADADPAELWATGELSAQREVIAMLITRLTISGTKVRGRSKFDPERLAIDWRY